MKSKSPNVLHSNEWYKKHIANGTLQNLELEVQNDEQYDLVLVPTA